MGLIQVPDRNPATARRRLVAAGEDFIVSSPDSIVDLQCTSLPNGVRLRPSSVAARVRPVPRPRHRTRAFGFRIAGRCRSCCTATSGRVPGRGSQASGGIAGRTGLTQQRCLESSCTRWRPARISDLDARASGTAGPSRPAIQRPKPGAAPIVRARPAIAALESNRMRSADPTDGARPGAPRSRYP